LAAVAAPLAAVEHLGPRRRRRWWQAAEVVAAVAAPVVNLGPSSVAAVVAVVVAAAAAVVAVAAGKELEAPGASAGIPIPAITTRPIAFFATNSSVAAVVSTEAAAT